MHSRALANFLQGTAVHVLQASLGFTVSRSYIFPIDDLPDFLQVVSLDIVVL